MTTSYSLQRIQAVHNERLLHRVEGKQTENVLKVEREGMENQTFSTSTLEIFYEVFNYMCIR